MCNLINVSVALGYTTFGLCALQMSIFNSIMFYILLYLDQEVCPFFSRTKIPR